jgi:hypothetical protein
MKLFKNKALWSGFYSGLSGWMLLFHIPPAPPSPLLFNTKWRSDFYDMQ